MNLSELNEVVSILRQSAEVDTSFCSMFQSDFPECVAVQPEDKVFDLKLNENTGIYEVGDTDEQEQDSLKEIALT
jgi:hypothetical protein